MAFVGECLPSWSLRLVRASARVADCAAIQVESVPKSVSEMIGEICRELAVLVLVFVPLELCKNSAISGYVIAAAIAGSIVLAAIGILIGSLRDT